MFSEVERVPVHCGGRKDCTVRRRTSVEARSEQSLSAEWLELSSSGARAIWRRIGFGRLSAMRYMCIRSSVGRSMKGKGLSEACVGEEVDIVAKPAHCESGGVGIMSNIASEVRIRFAGFGERLGVRLIMMVEVLVEEITEG